MALCLISTPGKYGFDLSGKGLILPLKQTNKENAYEFHIQHICWVMRYQLSIVNARFYVHLDYRYAASDECGY